MSSLENYYMSKKSSRVRHILCGQLYRRKIPGLMTYGCYRTLKIESSIFPMLTHCQRYFRHSILDSIGTKIIILEISLIIWDFSSVMLPIQCMTYTQSCFRQIITHCFLLLLSFRDKQNSVAFSPKANYTDRATAACRRS
jgi:hypothetical protein